MPDVTEHAPEVSTRSVTPVRARGESDSKTDGRTGGRTDKQLDRQTHRQVVQNHFSRRFECCTSQIRSYLEVVFLHDANTSINMEVKWLEETDTGHGNIGLLQALFSARCQCFH